MTSKNYARISEHF